MITYEKFFKILKDRKLGQLKFCEDNNISTNILHHMRKNDNIEVFTLNKLLNILELNSLDDICTYVPDEKEKNNNYN